MSVETNKLRSTREILDAVIVKLDGLKLQQGQPAFDRVEMFDLSDYLDAMQRLAMNQERTALVLWTGDDFESNRGTIILKVRRTSNIEVFITERNLAAPVKALTGDPENYLPGVLGLRDLVLPALTGELLPSKAETGAELIYLVPESVARGIISAEDKAKFPARQIIIINWQALGEFMMVGVEANEGMQ